jgi:hypothetical protein
MSRQVLKEVKVVKEAKPVEVNPRRLQRVDPSEQVYR